jgi:acetyl-CoA carboxylase biotin carboxyl carrier protein
MLKVTPEDLKSLIETFDSNDWTELHVTSEDFELYLSNDPAARPRAQVNQVPDSRPGPAGAVAPIEATKAGLATPAVSEQATVPDGLLAVRAPNLGTFYQSPKPGAKPYVEIGQRVDPTTELCVIEVMKLYTSVAAGVTGIVRKRLVKDAEMVEFDQPLFLIEPAPETAAK